VSFGEEVNKQVQEEVYQRMIKQGWKKVIHEVDMICMVNQKGSFKKNPMYAEIHNDGSVILLGAKQ
jgi:hypothetical protein